MPAGPPPVATPNGPSRQYHEWAREEPGAPARTPAGTVYSGGQNLPQQPAQPASSLESSGSLTGHILAQGRKDGPTPTSRTARVVVVMLVVMSVLVLVGVLAATVASDTVGEIFDNLVNG